MQQSPKVIITDFIQDGLVPERDALDGIAFGLDRWRAATRSRVLAREL